MTRDLVVELVHVGKWYGAFHALRDVSLGVARGETVAICGPSGSGKSTLIRCVNGLERHQEGEIRVAGTALGSDGSGVEEVRRRTGMVFQSFNLFPHLSVLDNLTLGPIYAAGEAADRAGRRALALLDRVGIADQAAKFPGQLSGGQQQRVAIARALMREPEVMLFDEPTSSLDPERVQEVLAVMEELAAGGMTMLVVTHEMGFIRRIADLVVFMDQGEVVEAAPPALFFAQTHTERARAFLGRVMHL
ncbi:MAG: amino acid ABC transporter ATP-binding protein [Alphaproteobacteria bacterium]|nr:amino acid ABC transporter ATP-binding protein [Alphaproteobacteria bacterium]